MHNDCCSDTHSLEIGITHQPGIWATTESSTCWTSHFYVEVLYTVTPKIVKSNDNVLSYTICVYKFNDCLTSSQLHYDWDKITVTRLNHILASATSPSSTGYTATLTALLAMRA